MSVVDGDYHCQNDHQHSNDGDDDDHSNECSEVNFVFARGRSSIRIDHGSSSGGLSTCIDVYVSWCLSM